MSFLVMFSTFGITLEIHSCQGEVQSIGIYTSAEQCDMESNKASYCDVEHHESGSHQILKNKCCDNSQFYNVLDPDISLSSNNLLVELRADVFDLTSFVVPHDQILDPQIEEAVSPPDILTSRVILFERFII